MCFILAKDLMIFLPSKETNVMALQLLLFFLLSCMVLGEGDREALSVILEGQD